MKVGVICVTGVIVGLFGQMSHAPLIDPRARDILTRVNEPLRRAASAKATLEVETFTRGTDRDDWPLPGFVREMATTALCVSRSGSVSSELLRLERRIGNTAALDSAPVKAIAVREYTVITPSGGWAIFPRSSDTATRISATDAADPGSYASPLLHDVLPLSDGRLLSVGEWGASRFTDPLLKSLTYSGTEEWQGTTYKVVDWVQQVDYSLPKDQKIVHIRLYVGPDSVIRRVVTRFPNGNWSDQRLIALSLNPPIAPGDFPSDPPAGVVVKPAPPEGYHRAPRKLPDFVGDLISDRQITRTTSGALIAGKKAVILWQWAYFCVPCRRTFPYMQQLYDAYRAKGVEVIAYQPIAAEMPAARKRFHMREAQDMLRANHADVPILFITGGMSQYYQEDVLVVDSAGTIVAPMVAFDATAIRDTLDRILSGH